MKKKRLITLLLFVTLLSQIAFSQKTVSQEKNVIKTNMMSILVGTGTLFYERKINDNLSGNLGIGFLNYTFSKTSFSGLILTPEVRFYPKKGAIDGFYMAPYFRLQRFQLKLNDNKVGYNNYGGGLVFGRQWITNSGFTMDLFFGGHYAKGTLGVTSGSDSYNTDLFEGFKMRLGFDLGFAF
jgi:hypothetical protein